MYLDGVADTFRYSGTFFNIISLANSFAGVNANLQRESLSNANYLFIYLIHKDAKAFSRGLKIKGCTYLKESIYYKKLDT